MLLGVRGSREFSKFVYQKPLGLLTLRRTDLFAQVIAFTYLVIMLLLIFTQILESGGI